jgi:hypothetical protein
VRDRKDMRDVLLLDQYCAFLIHWSGVVLSLHRSYIARRLRGSSVFHCETAKHIAKEWHSVSRSCNCYGGTVDGCGRAVRIGACDSAAQLPNGATQHLLATCGITPTSYAHVAQHVTRNDFASRSIPPRCTANSNGHAIRREEERTHISKSVLRFSLVAIINARLSPARLRRRHLNL